MYTYLKHEKMFMLEKSKICFNKYYDGIRYAIFIILMEEKRYLCSFIKISFCKKQKIFIINVYKINFIEVLSTHINDNILLTYTESTPITFLICNYSISANYLILVLIKLKI